MLRTELSWQAPAGSSGAIVSALSGWNMLRFEVTEDASTGCDPVRYSCTPSLGVYSATLAANGDIVIPENRLRAAMTLAASASSAFTRPQQRPVADPEQLGSLRETHGRRHPALGGSLEQELSLLLGEPWDAELEPFRKAAAGAPVRWLHATG